ncbi:MAG: WbuC family cupin fold metalloprotein [Dysgonamonadaceae bacterium]|jgi:cupin fold WbuC family metalloprotein|nr:WbuC family cupin fold metalloprotein [Dysgonamonadaceae bacterium]
MRLDTTFLDELSAEAKNSPRLRMNYNMHDSLDAKAQRLFNALEPGTLVPIHRHRDTAETFFVVRGKLIVRLFNDDKTVIEEVILSPTDDCFGYHVPKNQWHSVESLESGTVLFEVKDGPFIPIDEKNILTIKN